MCFPFGSGCRENLRGYFQRSNGQIEIGADRVLHKEGVQNSREDIHLTLRTNFRGARSYSAIANDTIGFYYRSSERANQWQEKWYALPTINPDFTIVLTKVDTTQKILSGEFSGKLFRLDYMTNMIIPTDSIIITEGRFDLKLPY
ncbi:MAG TPA: hypothetical protein VHM26_14630 [Chitinophagaceae bacterium]|nr:hypothetical protein [Chitinophagaceae bacterium]